MTTSIVILQLLILGVALESDLGRRKIGWFRVLRPILTIGAIIPYFLTSLPTSARDLALQGAGAAIGALLGLLCVTPRFISVGYDPAFRSRILWIKRSPRPAAVSHAGWGYGSIWVGMTAVRLAFGWSAQHLFPNQLAQFMIAHSLSAAALTNAFIFMAVAMGVVRAAGLAGRGWTARRQFRAGQPASAPMTVAAR